MATIYGRSAGNLIHLTDNHDMAERVIRLAHQIDKEARTETNGYDGMDHLLHTEAGALKYSPRAYREDIDRNALWFLVGLPWFR